MKCFGAILLENLVKLTRAHKMRLNTSEKNFWTNCMHLWSSCARGWTLTILLAIWYRNWSIEMKSFWRISIKNYGKTQRTYSKIEYPSDACLNKFLMSNSGYIATAAKAFVFKLRHMANSNHFSCHLIHKFKCQNEVVWCNFIRKYGKIHTSWIEIKWFYDHFLNKFLMPDSGCIAQQQKRLWSSCGTGQTPTGFFCHLIHKLKWQNEVLWCNFIRKHDKTHMSYIEI